MTTMANDTRSHGGSDALGVPRFDFSSNSNACGPCPHSLAAIQQADNTHYPDPTYKALRADLAAFHGVAPERVVLAASASEFIFRITAWVARSTSLHAGSASLQQARALVSVPRHAYGDYAHAARAWGMDISHQPEQASLVWLCEPSSPLGGTAALCIPARFPAPTVLDCAYHPLRLSATPSIQEADRACLWQLFSPNKALGLTGVRAAYAIAPDGAQDAAAALAALAPSWPLGGHGVALLGSWVQPQTQRWLQDSLTTLRQWKLQQYNMLHALGWTCHPSDANFFCAVPPAGTDLPRLLVHLRARGIKLRDTTSFGLPGWVRISVQPPPTQVALKEALQETQRGAPPVPLPAVPT